jgi:hypothetical protein
MKKTVFIGLALFVLFTATTCNNLIVRNLWSYEYVYEYSSVPVHSDRDSQDRVYLPTALLLNGKKIAWWGEGTAAHIPSDLGFTTYTVNVCMSGNSDFRPLPFPDTASMGNSSVEYYSLEELAHFEPNDTERAYTWHIAQDVDNPSFRECFSYNNSYGQVLKLPKSFTIGK